MISGTELRNSFNKIMRKLYNVKDGSGSLAGRSGTAGINSKSNIDIYLELCYDNISKYENESEVSEKNLKKFLKNFVATTKHFMSNQIKDKTRSETKKLFKEYVEEICENYSFDFNKYILKIEGFTRENLFEEVKTLKKNKDYNSSGIIFNKGYEKRRKKPITSNPNYNKYEEPEIELPEEVKDTQNFRLTRILKIFIFLIFIFFVFQFGPSLIKDFNQEQIQNISENKTPILPLEKPQAPTIEAFQLTQLELEVLDLINKKRIKFGHQKLILESNLSEIDKKYLDILISENEIAAKEKVGNLAQRKVTGNIKGFNLYESKSEIIISGSDTANLLLNEIKNLKLYSPDSTGLAIAISNVGNKYFVLLDIY